MADGDSVRMDWDTGRRLDQGSEGEKAGGQSAEIRGRQAGPVHAGPGKGVNWKKLIVRGLIKLAVLIGALSILSILSILALMVVCS